VSYYSLVEVTPSAEDWIPGYIAAVSPMVARYGGKYLARTASHERLEGAGENAPLRVIIEWPSKEVAMAFMQDPEYAPYLQARSNGSISHHFLVEGKDEFA
jgi:uncharacterized protein (DUF1330 family)